MDNKQAGPCSSREFRGQVQQLMKAPSFAPSFALDGGAGDLAKGILKVFGNLFG